MKVLVCGGRDFADRETLFCMLDGCHARHSFSAVIHGAARGADTFAGEWAKSRGVPCEPYPALWDVEGRAAGPLRNQRMLDNGRPDMVIAFPGRRGTADMVRRAKAAGVPVIEFSTQEQPEDRL